MTATLADLQRRVSRLTHARDEARRRAANVPKICVWLPQKDGHEHDQPPGDRGDGIWIYVVRESDRPEFDKWMNEQEDVV